jgi:dolichyl-phosphate-mannose-protein mannosyltransferase
MLIIYSGYDDVDDSNNLWRVLIDYDPHKDHLEPRRSRFQLLHVNQDCHLYSTNTRLPDWGFEQQEVSCIYEGLKPKTMWMVDETYHALLPQNISRVPEYRPGFLEKFIRMHRAMLTLHQELTGTHPFQSRPSSWLILDSYIPIWLGIKGQMYIFGNPFVYWISCTCVCLLLMVRMCLKLREKRGYKDRYRTSGGVFVLGWMCHFLPYFLMGRQLLLQHYIPALYFAVLTLGVCVDVVRGMFTKQGHIVVLLVSLGIVYTYYVYSPITYGTPWTVDACNRATVLDSWNFNCERYDGINIKPIRMKGYTKKPMDKYREASPILPTASAEDDYEDDEFYDDETIIEDTTSF